MKITKVITCPGQRRSRIGIGFSNGNIFIAFAKKSGFEETTTVLVFTFCKNYIEMSASMDIELRKNIISGSIKKGVTEELQSRLIYLHETKVRKIKTDKLGVDLMFKDLINLLSLKVKNKFGDKYNLKSDRYELTLKVTKKPINL